MNVAIPMALVAVLLALASIHVYWGVSGNIPGAGFVPESEGKPLFTPSRRDSFAVALALIVAAYVAASRAGLLNPAPPGSMTHWLAIAGGVVFLLRAVGEFRYIGMFKRYRDTRFATLDTWLFTPLCILIGSAFLFVAALR